MIPNKQIVTAIFLTGFLFSFGIAIPTYINSTFLSTYISEGLVGSFYIISSLLTIILLFSSRKILSKIGNYKATLGILIVNFLSLIMLVFCENFFTVAISLVVHLIAVTVISFNIDIFLEAFSNNSSTGKTRGTFLSLTNLAWLISPIISGFVLSGEEYWKIYLLSAIINIPVIYILLRNLKGFKDPEYQKVNTVEAFKTIYKRKNILKISWAHFLLRFFYSWMIIYMPIYLHDYIGFDWNTIGIIFTAMLLPFVILEMPLGKIADKFLGEKEILNTGFLIAGISTAVLTFVDSTDPVFWGFLLFMTRVGASMIEIASETYFFKKINEGDVEILNIFRMIGPSAYVVGPIVATVLLMFIEINYLFIILGILMAVGGTAIEMTLKDTK
ncbi:hypothetical protein A3I18_01010 [Candidatus Campbellbacteria bacterium RIFCSPLOWO2_02_FULL_35_11]|uniref:Major facilitator superfamily (MFS) profile domain-containing protein n=2 Tax=Candidatus Campbelliibacteriota TaxID=1752727 RepID=A0A1F5EKH7_9BACT|nr:MAG: hypothetical protein A3E89_02250 [Candidatus Campbellbacteria bacterium RIFCSPHIGHO2_12_FULL_35_10]OGD69686.1 MAG: hypothetical protein A3I18_01010 [Candidatus Campbellbacteria bacterium RIFCSPLOWO2_02_FULL_35_11]